MEWKKQEPVMLLTVSEELKPANGWWLYCHHQKYCHQKY